MWIKTEIGILLHSWLGSALDKTNAGFISLESCLIDCLICCWSLTGNPDMYIKCQITCCSVTYSVPIGDRPVFEITSSHSFPEDWFSFHRLPIAFGHTASEAAGSLTEGLKHYITCEWVAGLWFLITSKWLMLPGQNTNDPQIPWNHQSCS